MLGKRNHIATQQVLRAVDAAYPQSLVPSTDGTNALRLQENHRWFPGKHGADLVT